MSWNFRVVAQTKAAAKAAIAAEPSVLVLKYVPAPVVNALNAAVDGLPDSATRDICIETYGHVGQDVHGALTEEGGGNFQIKASLVDRPKEEVKVEVAGNAEAAVA